MGTVTEIYDYLRLLYARVGKPHCPVCGREITQQTIDQIVDRILALPQGTKLNILAPVVRNRKGEYTKLFEDASKSGFVRVRADGILYDLLEKIPLEKNKKHNIEIVVDRLVIKEGIRRRLSDSVETALHHAKGLVIAQVVDGEEMLFSQNYSCPDHDFFNRGAQPAHVFRSMRRSARALSATGWDIFLKLDMDLVIPDRTKSINEGAIKASGWNSPYGDSISKMYFSALAKRYDFSLDTPDMRPARKCAGYNPVRQRRREKIQMQRKSSFGSVNYESAYEGVIPNIERRFKETTSDFMRREIESLYARVRLPRLQGGRRLPPTCLP